MNFCNHSYYKTIFIPEGKVQRGLREALWQVPVAGPEASGTQGNTGGFSEHQEPIVSVRVPEHWHRLPRKRLDVPSVEMFKVRLEEALSNPNDSMK